MLHISPSYMLQHYDVILQGAGTTLYVSLVSIAIATILALLGSIARLSSNPIAQGISGFYVSLVRGTPLLIQIYVIYLGLPQIGEQINQLGFPVIGRIFILDAVPAGILALSLNYGAYMTEIFRAGLQSIGFRSARSGNCPRHDSLASDEAGHSATSHPHHHSRCGQSIHCHAKRLRPGFRDGRLGNHLYRKSLCAARQQIYGNVHRRRDGLLDIDDHLFVAARLARETDGTSL